MTETDLVIYSSAIKAGNVAYDAARKLGLPMVRRADALAAIMSAKKGIVICGMHGKTTTSSMAAHVFEAAASNPRTTSGRRFPILGTNARWDSEGEYFVAEGDESDGTLINYHPDHAIVLNIEPEHLDFYKDLAAIDAVYAKLVGQTRGKVVYCGDDPGRRASVLRTPARSVTDSTKATATESADIVGAKLPIALSGLERMARLARDQPA